MFVNLYVKLKLVDYLHVQTDKCAIWRETWSFPGEYKLKTEGGLSSLLGRSWPEIVCWLCNAIYASDIRALLYT